VQHEEYVGPVITLSIKIHCWIIKNFQFVLIRKPNGIFYVLGHGEFYVLEY